MSGKKAPPVIEALATDLAPMPETVDAIEAAMPQATDLVLADPRDQHAVSVVLDAHDIAMIIDRAQSSALKKWVYKIPGTGQTGLSVHGVQDIVQQMNWTGKARIGLVRESLVVTREMEDVGNGFEEPVWSAIVFGRDEVTGMEWPGVSTEPVHMKLTERTAGEWTRKGKVVPDDRRVFDVFSKTKAVQKACRNAVAAFIPEELEQTVIAMFENDPRRVEKIQTEQEAKLADLPAALTDERAVAQVARARELYSHIRDVAGGQGKVKYTPAHFNGQLTSVQHDHARLDDFIAYLEHQLEVLPGQILAENQQREAVETANLVACPVCEQAAKKFCKNTRGAHPERVAARLAQIQKAGAS